MARPGTRSGVNSGMPPTDEPDELRRKLTHAEAVIVELRGVVAELRQPHGCEPLEKQRG